ncbi:hypothetical protein LCA30_12360 [Vibrio harveyi]|uniref:hypothetical protein n=1 Tax=Vibrio harveyi TaxID=669 RepID=UPI0018B02A4C|nr:hypothetical protein [Vibrio harveyi]
MVVIASSPRSSSSSQDDIADGVSSTFDGDKPSRSKVFEFADDAARAMSFF